MASSSFLLVFFSLLSLALAKTPPRPILQVTKDAKTLQYITQISQRTPLVPVKLTLDLGGPFMWVNCERDYASSTYHPDRCGSPTCGLLNTTSCDFELPCHPPAIGCFNKTCTDLITNPIAYTGSSIGQFGADIFKISSTHGHVLTVPRLHFICGNNFIVDNLATGVTGMAGLGWSGASLPAQLSSYFRFDPKFALCLSSSTRSSGVVLFGDGISDVETSFSLTYTPLFINPFPGGGYLRGTEPNYFIGVKSIKVNNERVNAFSQCLLSIDGKGNGGTTISTAEPYTLLETSIHKAVVAAFVKAMPKNVEKVANVGSFRACFRSENISSTPLGPDVPFIDLELESKNVWRINGANLMVEVKKNVLCLGFVDYVAPTDPFIPSISVVIGGHQIEDNLLQFDLSASRLGFSSSLLGQSTSCANFNFTSTM